MNQDKSKMVNIIKRLLALGLGSFGIFALVSTSYKVTKFMTTQTAYSISYEIEIDYLTIGNKDADIRLAIKSADGVNYIELTPGLQSDTIDNLNHDTSYELTIETYNNFRWVELESKTIRTTATYLNTYLIPLILKEYCNEEI